MSNRCAAGEPIRAGQHCAKCGARQNEQCRRAPPDNAEAQLAAIRALVNQQAEDAGLWFMAEHCSEAYLQAALRKLHAAIEARD